MMKFDSRNDRLIMPNDNEHNDILIPFDAACPEDPFWSEENMARLRKSIDQLEAGKGTVHDVDCSQAGVPCRPDVPNAATAEAPHDAGDGTDMYGPFDTVEDSLKALDED